MNPKKIGIILVVIIAVLAILLVYRGQNKPEEALGVKTEEEAKISDITAQEVHKLITDNQGNDNFVILDVRAPQEFASGYIEGAINFNYIASNFKEEIEKLDRNKTYLVYCQSGRRSSAATKIMQELGFEDVYNMQGGFSQWQAENLSVVKE